MKKNLLWMLAAILVCGAIATSCSKDDDEKKTESKETKKSDITLILVTHDNISALIDYEFSYTDHNGKKSTPVTLTGFEDSEALTSEEASFIKTMYDVDFNSEGFYSACRTFHFTIKDVPDGSTISYETIQRNVKDIQAPTESITYVVPSVIFTKMTSNVISSGRLATLSVSKRLDKWFEDLVANDGKPLLNATGTFTTGPVTW